jgi:hypothetical protein
MARVYTKFLAGRPTPELARIARRRRAQHLVEAAARLLAARELAPACRCLGRAALDGAGPRRLAWALARGMRRSSRGLRGADESAPGVAP